MTTGKPEVSYVWIEVNFQLLARLPETCLLIERNLSSSLQESNRGKECFEGNKRIWHL